MINSNNKLISTHDLFPIFEEVFKSGSRTKFTVTGNSMLPWIAGTRDQVLLADKNSKQLKPGDIILYLNMSGNYILHRIYKREAYGFRTIGDACIMEDGFVSPDDIIGFVEIIYRKGKKINCYSLTWRLLFTIWRKLLPIRRYLLKLYYSLVGAKGWIKKRFHNWETYHG